MVRQTVLDEGNYRYKPNSSDASLDLSTYDFSALIFDCDGTLADTAPMHTHALQSALMAQNLQLDADWYGQRVGLSQGDLIQAYEREYGVVLEKDAFDIALAQCYASTEIKPRPIEFTVSVARSWYKKVPMAVASGGRRPIVMATLRDCELDHLFQTVVTIEDVKKGKPDPEIFLEAARRLRVPPSRCLVFEDSAEGLEAARRATMQALDVTRC
jgi:beta-phosphoglucomutase-like phosphatase (HAD superfamily)